MTGRTIFVVTTVAVIAMVTCTSSLPAQSYRRQDATVGGIAGAVIGGIIGHQNNETPEGALIGGAVGAIAGSMIGDAKDQEVARQRYYRHQVYQQQLQQQQALGRAVTIPDVVSMSRSGLSEAVIINQIRQHGVVDPIGTHEIISMHNQGVSERVITAMQSAPRAGAVPQTVVVERPVVQPRPVVVQEYILPAPRVHYRMGSFYHTYPSSHRYHHHW